MSRPTKIMLIRHAERPAKVGSPYGTTTDGDKDANSLATPGWQRAGALACLLAPAHGSLQNPELATPQSLFATDVGRLSPSNREQQTITPLSSKLGLKMNAEHVKQDHESMLKDAMACDGVVLICWDHKFIPAVANEILGNTTTSPHKWKKKRFDLVWVFDWDPSSETYGFKQVPQCLLSGDSKKPIKSKHAN